MMFEYQPKTDLWYLGEVEAKYCSLITLLTIILLTK